MTPLPFRSYPRFQRRGEAHVHVSALNEAFAGRQGAIEGLPIASEAQVDSIDPSSQGALDVQDAHAVLPRHVPDLSAELRDADRLREGKGRVPGHELSDVDGARMASILHSTRALYPTSNSHIINII